MTAPRTPPPFNPPTPRRRTWRTAVQVAVAVLGAVPAAVAALEAANAGVPVRVTSLLIGGSGAAVVLISAAQNALDERAGRG